MCNLILTVMLAMASLFGVAAQANDCTAGEEYVGLSNPMSVSQPGKIEVVELSWYGCPHCYTFEPTIVPWSEELPADVHFAHLPALFDGIWNVHGQMFLTLESTGVKHDVHNAVFEAIHKGHEELATPEEMADFLADRSVDKEEFLSTYNSFAIKGQIEKAKKLAMAYQVTGVPTMVANGEYRFDIDSAGGPEETFKLVGYLVEKECVAAKKQAR